MICCFQLLVDCGRGLQQQIHSTSLNNKENCSPNLPENRTRSRQLPQSILQIPVSSPSDRQSLEITQKNGICFFYLMI